MRIFGTSCDSPFDSESEAKASLFTCRDTSQFGALLTWRDDDVGIRFFRDEIKAAKMET